MSDPPVPVKIEPFHLRHFDADGPEGPLASQAHLGFVKARTAQANQIRGLLGEFGLVIPKGIYNVAKRVPELQRTAPVVGARAGFHANQTRGQIAKKHGNLRAPQLLTQHRLAILIDPMHLKYILRQINSNRCNLHRGRSHSFKW
jgi:hypothetical protein